MLMKLLYASLVCLMALIPFSTAFGCAYTVRDVGFADIGSVPYRLYYYVQNDTPTELVSMFRQISYAALIDSNVEAKIINIDSSTEQSNDEKEEIHNQAIKYHEFWGIKSFPAAILTSPDGRSLPLSLSKTDNPSKEEMWSVLDSAVISQKRIELTSSVVETYCAIILAQGEDTTENERAKKAIDDAIQRLDRIMSQMPRPIEKLPSVITIPRESSHSEKVLLWSLGIEKQEKPYAAAIYGRGRHIGQLFIGEKITADEVFNVISIIGQSCECGIDRAYLLGTMLPLRWGEKTQSELAKLLGFDVENPMIKTEMSQIMSTGSPTSQTEAPLSGYRETVVEFVESPSTSTVSPAQLRQLVSPEPANESNISRQGAFLSYKMALLIIGALALLIVIAGVFIILKARRRAS